MKWTFIWFFNFDKKYKFNFVVYVPSTVKSKKYFGRYWINSGKI